MENHREKEIASGSAIMQQFRAVVGGIMCCVPECFNNSLRNPELSYYVIPNGNSKENQELRKRWLHLISRRDFHPGPRHSVCSEHFVGGKKTYMNNVPTVVPKNREKKDEKGRFTYRSRNRTIDKEAQDAHLSVKEMDDGESGTNVVFAGEELELEEQQSCMNEPINREILEIKIAQLESENEKLMKENRKLLEDNAFLATKLRRGFSIDNIKDDRKLFSFYTGLPDYEKFKILFNSFGSAVNNLVYIDSNTNRNKSNSPFYTKRGPKRNLTPEQEFFLVLVRLRLGLLEEDLAYRAGVSTTSFSRIWITWLDFLHSKFRAFPIWPSKSCVQKTMPSCFKESYPNTSVIIDCTEIFIERPSSV